MFLTEKELKETFWKNYNYSNRAKRYMFECPIRDGGADLVTIEEYQGNFQINAFEFKLNDIKKVILQAEGNIPYVNKSWIVVPSEKENVIMDRYINPLKNLKHIGVIVIEAGGRWKIIHKPIFNNNLKYHNEIINLMMKG